MSTTNQQMETTKLKELLNKGENDNSPSSTNIRMEIEGDTAELDHDQISNSGSVTGTISTTSNNISNEKPSNNLFDNIHKGTLLGI